MGIDIIRFKPGNRDYYSYLGYSSALSMQFSEIVLSEMQNSLSPDFIETQDYHGIGYYLILKKRLGEKQLVDIPIVLTAHAPSYYYLDCNQAPVFALPDYWTGEMEKWVMQAADVLISPSHYLVENVKQYLNGNHKNYHIIRNPYKIPTPTVSNTFPEVEDIVFFGKLTYQKGCLQLLKYLSALWDEGLDKRVSFIGDDHYFEPKQINMKEYLITKFKKHFENGYFTFEGKLNPEQLEKRLNKASLIIVPSLVDNFPYAVVESMLQGKVLLISDGGGQSEMIEDGKSGFVYKATCFESFRQKFKVAAGISSTEALIISANAKSRINSMCNYENVYAQKIKVLNSFTNNKKEFFPFVNVIDKVGYKVKSEGLKGKLSIVVPYYNTGKYIKETIESIYQITYEDFEVIVVNDGSDDAESISILNALEKKYEFKVISQKNAGLSAARNTGVTGASGEYIAFLDADDKIHPEFYVRAINILKKYSNLSFVSSWVKYFDASEGIWPAQNPEPPFLLLQNMVNAGFLCRKIDYLNFGVNDSKFEYGMEDYDANMTLLENGCRGVVLPEPLYYYRIHSASMARGFNKFNRLYLYRIMSNKHKALYQKYGYEIFNLLLANGPSYLYDNPTLKPATDVIEYQKRIKDLEEAVGWYDRTLKYHEHTMKTQVNSKPEDPFPTAHLAHNANSYEDLKAWYHKEYEVLPLWYKRAGHVVKVLQGNRSLKSLFKKD